MMAAIVDLLPDEARHIHPPTEEELARTYPGGVIPDGPDDVAGHERDRRPGQD